MFSKVWNAAWQSPCCAWKMAALRFLFMRKGTKFAAYKNHTSKTPASPIMAYLPTVLRSIGNKEKRIADEHEENKIGAKRVKRKNHGYKINQQCGLGSVDIQKRCFMLRAFLGALQSSPKES